MKKVIVLGKTGLVGSALIRVLMRKNYTVFAPRRKYLDILNYNQLLDYIKTTSPDIIFMAAGLVGGITRNKNHPADFITQNSKLALNIIESTHKCKIPKLVYLASSCIYPTNSPQPMKEDCLLTGKLEPTNQPYAIAKLLGIELVRSYNTQHGTDYLSIIPCNLAGKGDNYSLENGHVLPNLVRKFLTGNEIVIHGNGENKREFMLSDDAAEAIVWASENIKSNEPINLGNEANRVSIKDCVNELKDILNYYGDVVYDTNKISGANCRWLHTNELFNPWKKDFQFKTIREILQVLIQEFNPQATFFST